MTTCFVALALSGLSPAVPAPAGGEHRARARLVSEETALIPGKAAFVGLTFDIDPGWHLYWHGASDSGMPITFKFDVPSGVTIGPALWPAPKRHVAPGDVLDYIYERRVTLLVPVTVAEGKPGSPVTLKGNLSWMVCKDVCLLEEAEVSIDIPVGAPGAAPGRTTEAPLFAEARRTIPKEPAREKAPFSTRWEDRTLKIQAPGSAGVALFVGADSATPANAVRDGDSKADSVSLELAPEQKERAVTGVLEIRRPSGAPSEYYTIKVPLGGAFAGRENNPRPKG